jgi:hypothetical protein
LLFSTRGEERQWVRQRFNVADGARAVFSSPSEQCVFSFPVRR